jgi:hypothetical protein
MIWVTHMKTTVDIDDRLLQRAKALAVRRGTTLRDVVESALRAELATERAQPRRSPIRTKTFGGNGLQPGLEWDDWGTLRTLAYEGRGG